MAKKQKTMSFEWVDNATGIVQRLGFGTALNEYFAQTLLDYAEPYTPEDTSHMINHATVIANPMNAKIVYSETPYADIQYNNENYEHPKELATDHWLEEAWRIHKFEISGKVGARVRWRK